MSDEAFLISKRFLDILRTVVRRVLTEMSPTDARRRRIYESAEEWQGLTTSTLAGPSSQTVAWVTPTTCTFQPYRIDPTSTSTPKKMIASTTDGPFTIVNRDPTLNLPSGSYVRVKRIDGDWTIVWVQCA